MPAHATLALILASPGPLRDSLQALLTTLPQISVLAESRDPLAVERVGCQTGADLVIIDAPLPGEDAVHVLMEIKGRWPRTRSVVLVDDSSQNSEYWDAGATAVLQKGSPASEFVRIVAQLLADD